MIIFLSPLQAAGDIVVEAIEALDAIISIDMDLPNCEIVATSRIYDPEAENIFGEGFFSFQIEVSQRVNVTSQYFLGLELVTSIVEDGFDVTTGGQSQFRTLLLEHPMFVTILVVKVRRSLADPQVFPTPLPSFSSSPTTEQTQVPTFSSAPSSSMDPTIAPSFSPAPSLSKEPTALPTVSSAPSDLPTLVPSTTPSILPSLYPSSSPSLIPTSMPSSKPSSPPSTSPSMMPVSANDSNQALRDGGGEYKLTEDAFAIAAIVGGLTAILVSSICFLFFRYHRKVGVIRDRPDALTTKDGQNRLDGSSIVPPKIVDLDQESLSDTSLGYQNERRNRRRKKTNVQSVQPILPIDSIDENSLYTSPLTLKMDNASSRHSRTSNLSSPGKGPLDYEVATLFPLSTTSSNEYSDEFDTDTPSSISHTVAKRPRLKQLRGIGPLDLESRGTKTNNPKHDEAKAKKVSEALGRNSHHSRVWEYDTDWSYNAEGSISSRRSYSSRRSRSSRSSYRGISAPLGSANVGIRDRAAANDVSRSSYRSTMRKRHENDSSHSKSLDGTESSLVVSHISDKDFIADMQSVDSAGSQSSATSSRSYSSRSARRSGPLADFFESMMKATGPYRRTSIPRLTPEGKEFVPDLEDSTETSKKGPDESPPHSSEDTSSGPLSTSEANEMHSSVESSEASSESSSGHAKSWDERQNPFAKVTGANTLSTPSRLQAHEGSSASSPSQSGGSSPSESLTLLQMEKFDEMDAEGWERGENDLMVDYSKDDDSASSGSTEKSPRAWLLDTVAQTLGPRSMSADMESLEGRPSRSNRGAKRRSPPGKKRFTSPHVLAREKKRLEIQLSSLDNDQVTVSSVGASSIAGSFSTIGSRSRAAKVSRKKRIVVLVPPGKLGVVLANRSGNKGTVVAEIRKTSVLHGMISQGDRLLAVDGEDVTGMTMSQVTALMTSKASLERRLTIVTSVQHKQP